LRALLNSMRPFDTPIYDLFKMKQSHCGCCAMAKNCDWFRQITPLSNLDSSVASRGMKTYSEARIELRNLQFLKKMLEKSSQFLSSDQPSEPKSSDVALNIAGVEKYARKACALRLRSTWRPFDSSFERKDALVTVEICVLCGR